MPEYYKVTVDYDAMIREVQRKITRDLPVSVVRVLITAAAVSSVYYLDDDNEPLQIVALQITQLAHRVLEDAGVEKEARGPIFDVVDEVFASVYTQAATDLERDFGPINGKNEIKES